MLVLAGGVSSRLTLYGIPRHSDAVLCQVSLYLLADSLGVCTRLQNLLVEPAHLVKDSLIDNEPNLRSRLQADVFTDPQRAVLRMLCTNVKRAVLPLVTINLVQHVVPASDYRVRPCAASEGVDEKTLTGGILGSVRRGLCFPLVNLELKGCSDNAGPTVLGSEQRFDGGENYCALSGNAIGQCVRVVRRVQHRTKQAVSDVPICHVAGQSSSHWVSLRSSTGSSSVP